MGTLTFKGITFTVGQKLWDRQYNWEHEIRAIVDERLVLRYRSQKSDRWAYEIIIPDAVEMGVYATEKFPRAATQWGA